MRDRQHGAQREPARPAHLVLPVLCPPSRATLAAFPWASLVPGYEWTPLALLLMQLQESLG